MSTLLPECYHGKQILTGRFTKSLNFVYSGAKMLGLVVYSFNPGHFWDIQLRNPNIQDGRSKIAFLPRQRTLGVATILKS